MECPIAVVFASSSVMAGPERPNLVPSAIPFQYPDFPIDTTTTAENQNIPNPQIVEIDDDISATEFSVY